MADNMGQTWYKKAQRLVGIEEKLKKGWHPYRIVRVVDGMPSLIPSIGNRAFMALSPAHALKICMSAYPWLSDVMETLGRDSVVAELDQEAYKRMKAEVESRAKAREIMKEIREKSIQEAWWQK